MPIMTRMRESMPIILFGLLIAFLITIIFEWGMDYLGIRGGRQGEVVADVGRTFRSAVATGPSGPVDRVVASARPQRPGAHGGAEAPPYICQPPTANCHLLRSLSMRRGAFSVFTALLLGAGGLLAQPAPSRIKPCEELKQEIEAKLKAKGVKGYTLEIVQADQVKDQKVVGSCEAGKKKIVYARK